MFGEPQLKIPQWPENLDEILLRIAQPPMNDACHHGPDTALRQTKVLAAVPDTMHCSAYTLAQLITTASRFRRLEYYPLNSKVEYLSRFATHWLPEVLFEYEDISNSSILDSGVTYGIRVNFEKYWKALSRSPTKWYQTPDDKTLVAASAWGTTRLSQDAGSLLLEFAAPQSTNFDYELFGGSVFLPVEGMPNVEIKYDMLIRENQYLTDRYPTELEKIYPKQFRSSVSLLTTIWRGTVYDALERNSNNWVLHMPASRFVYLKEHILKLVTDSGLPRKDDYLTTPMSYPSSGYRLHADCLEIITLWIGTLAHYPFVTT